MKKKLLCMFTCMSMLLVACSGAKDKDKNKESNKADSTSYEQYVTLGEYKGMKLTKEVGQVEDQDLQNKINEILQENSSVAQIKEGTVKDGDTVNIDYVGKVDGKAFDNGTAQGQSLKIGSNSYIPGFESGLVGAKVGDVVTVNVKFPDDYGVDDLNGKDATFDVTINFIEGETKVPEWTDDFVKTVSDYNSTKEYEAQLKVELEQELEQTEEYTLQANIITNLVNDAKFSGMPEDEVNAQADSMKQYYKDYASKNNIEYEQFITDNFQCTEEEFNKQVQTTSENALKSKMVIMVLANKEKLIPEGEELEGMELKTITNYGYTSLEDFQKDYGDDYALQLVARDLVVKYIEENATITETEAPVSAEPEATTAE